MGEKGGENLLAPEFSAPWFLRGETGKQPRGDRGSAGQPHRGWLSRELCCVKKAGPRRVLLYHSVCVTFLNFRNGEPMSDGQEGGRGGWVSGVLVSMVIKG